VWWVAKQSASTAFKTENILADFFFFETKEFLEELY
jgi:hypothetical protein